MDEFSKVLMDVGYTVMIRKTRGDDIDAALRSISRRMLLTEQKDY